MNYLNMDNVSSGVVIGMLIASTVVMLIVFAVWVVNAVCSWILYERAGEKGWTALIPFYNTLIKSKIAFGSYSWGIVQIAFVAIQIMVTLLQSLVMAIGGPAFIFTLIVYALRAAVWCANAVISFFFCKSYGKSEVWCVLSVIFPFIILIILVFDTSAIYVGSESFAEEYFDKIKNSFGGNKNNNGF